MEDKDVVRTNEEIILTEEQEKEFANGKGEENE